MNNRNGSIVQWNHDIPDASDGVKWPLQSARIVYQEVGEDERELDNCFFADGYSKRGKLLCNKVLISANSSDVKNSRKRNDSTEQRKPNTIPHVAVDLEKEALSKWIRRLSATGLRRPLGASFPLGIVRLT